MLVVRSRRRRWASLVGLIVLFAAFVDVLEYIDCHCTWGDSGMAVRWGWLSGCRVKGPDGFWIPAKAFRKLP